jgi:hypothetical protein
VTSLQAAKLKRISNMYSIEPSLFPQLADGCVSKLLTRLDSAAGKGPPTSFSCDEKNPSVALTNDRRSAFHRLSVQLDVQAVFHSSLPTQAGPLMTGG